MAGGAPRALDPRSTALPSLRWRAGTWRYRRVQKGTTVMQRTAATWYGTTRSVLYCTDAAVRWHLLRPRLHLCARELAAALAQLQCRNSRKRKDQPLRSAPERTIEYPKHRTVLTEDRMVRTHSFSPITAQQTIAVSAAPLRRAAAAGLRACCGSRQADAVAHVWGAIMQRRAPSDALVAAPSVRHGCDSHRWSVPSSDTEEQLRSPADQCADLCNLPARRLPLRCALPTLHVA